MRLGRKLEPVVISEFLEETGYEVDTAPCPMFRHPQHDFVLATPDAILAGGDLLEAKTTSFRLAKELGEEGSDFIPSNWVCQCQQQLSVTGARLCHLAALIDGRTLRLYQVARNDTLIEGIIAAERELWERIVNRDPPEPNFEHARTAELIRELHGLAEGRTIVLESDVATLWQQQRELAEQIKTLESEREQLRSRVLHAMGDAAIAACPGFEFELTRSIVKEATYTVERKAYIQIRQRKRTSK